MGETNIDVIESWTPKEFDLLLKGAKHKQIDKHEFYAWAAMATGYAVNAGKKAKQNKIFDAKKARRQIQEGFSHKESEIKEIVRLNRAVKGFDPAAHFKPKGG